nr:MAG TPA: RecT protein [Caudoviricetes sp.]
MSNELAVQQSEYAVLNMPQSTAIATLKASLYPGASDESVINVLEYCRAAKLDPMQRPVHIVPMWDAKTGKTRDTIMPGVNFHLTAAERNGCAGIGEPEYGPDVTEVLGEERITYPAWCKVKVLRLIDGGRIAEFVGYERFTECVSTNKKGTPNAMWKKRPYGMLAKCAMSQALRKGFPSVAGAYTAEEMVGKTIGEDDYDGFVVDESEAAKPSPTAGIKTKSEAAAEKKRATKAKEIVEAARTGEAVSDVIEDVEFVEAVAEASAEAAPPPEPAKTEKKREYLPQAVRPFGESLYNQHVKPILGKWTDRTLLDHFGLNYEKIMDIPLEEARNIMRFLCDEQ